MIYPTLLFRAGIAFNGPSESSFSVGISGKFRMTPPGSTILCQIAHILPRLAGSHEYAFSVSLVTAEVSNLDQLFFTGGAIMMVETSTSSLFFRSSELSQPI